jgi:hypothetical protein
MILSTMCRLGLSPGQVRALCRSGWLDAFRVPRFRAWYIKSGTGRLFGGGPNPQPLLEALNKTE